MSKPVIIICSLIVFTVVSLGVYRLSYRPVKPVGAVNVEIGRTAESIYFHVYSVESFFSAPNIDQHNTSTIKKSFGKYDVTLGTVRAESIWDCLGGLPDGCNEHASVDGGLALNEFGNEIEFTITNGLETGRYLVVVNQARGEIKELQPATFVKLTRTSF